MKIYYFCLALAMLLLPPTFSSASTIHVILYGENDPNQKITRSCQRDLELYREEIRTVCRHTGMTPKFYPTEYRKENLEKVLTELTCGSDDVIFFVYSGHGYQWSGSGSEYPSLNFNESSTRYPHVKIETVHERLRAKRARLVITIADACNRIAGGGNGSLTGATQKRQQYIRLFKLYQGHILLAAAKSGQFAWSYSNGAGGLLSLSFLEVIHRATSGSSVASWESILNATHQLVLAKSESDGCQGCQRQETLFHNATQLRRQKNTFYVPD
jgi:hypothetical protein